MLQFHKVFTIFIGTLARPIITYTKQYQLQNKAFTHSYLRNFFIFLGKKYHRFEILMSQRFNQFQAPQMNNMTDDSAFFYFH